MIVDESVVGKDAVFPASNSLHAAVYADKYAPNVLCGLLSWYKDKRVKDEGW
jgi:hypothetical protein